MEDFSCCLWNERHGYGKAEKISASNVQGLLLGDYYPYGDNDEKGHYHNTRLHKAVKYECISCLEYLFSVDFKRQVGHYFFEMLNARNRFQETPLLYGLRNDVDPEVLALLISEHCDVTAADVNGETALQKLCNRGPIHLIVMLLENGADVDAEDPEGYTSLYEAVYEERQDVVALLLAHNAKVKGPFDRNPFMKAISLKSIRLVRLLINHVDNINEEYRHAPYIPGYHGDFDDECYGTALHIAALRSTAEICQEIIDHGGDVNYVSRTGSKSCLYRALEALDNDAFKVIWKALDQKRVLEYKIDILTFFLRYSTSFGREQMMEVLEIIFASPYIDDIIEHHLHNPLRDYLEAEAVDFFDLRMIRPYQLLFQRVFLKGNTEKNLNCINLFLAHSIPIYYGEIAYLFKYFGYGRELDAIVRSGVEVRHCPMDDAWIPEVHEFVSHLLYNDTGKKDLCAPSLLQLARDAVRRSVDRIHGQSGSCGTLRRIRELQDAVPTTVLDVLLLKRLT